MEIFKDFNKLYALKRWISFHLAGINFINGQFQSVLMSKRVWLSYGRIIKRAFYPQVPN